jgi:hypothetical protein
MTAKDQRKPHQDEDKRKGSERDKREEKLDKALEDTYPGSDPVSIVQPAPSAEDRK